MGKVPPKDEKRNQRLIKDYQQHTIVDGKKVYEYSIVRLVAKYRINSARIYQILKNYGVPSRKLSN